MNSIIPANSVEIVKSALSVLILKDGDAADEAQRLLTIITTSSEENGGPAVLDEKDADVLVSISRGSKKHMHVEGQP